MSTFMPPSHSWADETCESCVFRIGSYCRKEPPTITNLDVFAVGDFPLVKELVASDGITLRFSAACSHLELEQEPDDIHI